MKTVYVLAFILWLLIFRSLIMSAQTQIDPVLKPLYDEYLKEAKMRGYKLDASKLACVSFPNEANQKIINDWCKKDVGHEQWFGVTHFGDNGKISVFMNAGLYFYLNAFYRKLALYHELTHAFFGGQLDAQGIMSANYINQNWTENDLNKMLDEKFNHTLTIK